MSTMEDDKNGENDLDFMAQARELRLQSLGRMSQSSMAKKQSLTYNSMQPLDSTLDPYQQFQNHVDGPSAPGRTDGDKDLLDVQHLDHKDDLQPTNLEVIYRFEEHLESLSPLSDDEEERLRKLTISQKWEIIVSQDGVTPQHSPKVYIEHFKKYVRRGGSQRRRTASIRSSRDLGGSLAIWLGKLKRDLKYATDNFQQEFVSAPHNGVQVLVDVLRSMQTEQTAAHHSLRRSKSDTYKQVLIDEYDCLLCIKFATKSQDGVEQLATGPGAMNVITMCMMSTYPKTTIAVIQILTVACETQGGLVQVGDAMSLLRSKFSESVRFKMLVGMLKNWHNRHFQAVCVGFFNKLLSSTENGNARVYLQEELLLAGFDPEALHRYSLGQKDEYIELEQELDIWRKNYINVENSNQDLFEIKNRNVLLRQEIDRLHSEIGKGTKERDELTSDKTKWKDKCQKNGDKAAELQDIVTKISKLYTEKTGLLAEDEVDMDLASGPLDTYPDSARSVSDSISLGSVKIDSLASSFPAPIPPPAPPAFLSQTVRQKVKPRVRLPLYNWSPLHAVAHTMFEDINDEAKIREIDFEEFESLFELQAREEREESKRRREDVLKKVQSQICFVETNRAKNMIITKRRTGLTARDIKDAIDKCDEEALPGEYAELLLKYIPTKEELKKLADNAKYYKRLGEAEQFLFQMTHVDRLEKKLGLLAFMGVFEEIRTTVVPQLESIYISSDSVHYNLKLKKIFEIILAFGNYMNSSKRGYSLGFKLESLAKLSDVKARDRERNLLHYLVKLIETKYPELADFHEELVITVEKGTSYQALASDIHGLRKGVDLLKFEMEKQPDNPALDTFHEKASTEVMEIAESFRRTEDAYKSMCESFGENYRLIEPDDLFAYFKEFINEFKKASEENYKQKHPDAHVLANVPMRQPKVASFGEEGRSMPTPKPISIQRRIRPDSSASNGSSERDNDTKAPAPERPSPPNQEANVVTKISVARDSAYQEVPHVKNAKHLNDLLNALEPVSSRGSRMLYQNGELKRQETFSMVFKAKTTADAPVINGLSRNPPKRQRTESVESDASTTKARSDTSSSSEMSIGSSASVKEAVTSIAVPKNFSSQNNHVGDDTSQVLQAAQTSSHETDPPEITYQSSTQDSNAQEPLKEDLKLRESSNESPTERQLLRQSNYDARTSTVYPAASQRSSLDRRSTDLDDDKPRPSSKNEANHVGTSTVYPAVHKTSPTRSRSSTATSRSRTDSQSSRSSKYSPEKTRRQSNVSSGHDRPTSHPVANDTAGRSSGKRSGVISPVSTSSEDTATSPQDSAFTQQWDEALALLNDAIDKEGPLAEETEDSPL